MQIYDWNSLKVSEQQAILRRPQLQTQEMLSQTVGSIIHDVKTKGDQALYDFTKRFDGVTLNNLMVTTKEFSECEVNASSQAALKFAYQQIKEVYQSQVPQAETLLEKNGITITKQTRPIQRVGFYIPGGVAPLVSTVLMLGVPAKLANCPEIVLCTPPDQQGNINPYLLYAADLCGITQIFKLGGAQAIAAMAYGSESIPKVDKIFGPGNAWVTEAKIQVSQDPAGARIDLPAGPSEVLVIADGFANPQFVAADLLAQAEHSVDAQVILISLSQTMIERTLQAITEQLAYLDRKAVIAKSLQHARFIIVNTVEQALQISNTYAPEHLILHVETPEALIEMVQNAGSVFLGQWAAETFGDYVTGSNHVLPTYGYAKTYSGLSVNDFMKTINFQSIDVDGFAHLASVAMQFAEIEGLHAHKNAVQIRKTMMEAKP